MSKPTPPGNACRLPLGIGTASQPFVLDTDTDTPGSGHVLSAVFHQADGMLSQNLYKRLLTNPLAGTPPQLGNPAVQVKIEPGVARGSCAGDPIDLDKEMDVFVQEVATGSRVGVPYSGSSSGNPIDLDESSCTASKGCKRKRSPGECLVTAFGISEDAAGYPETKAVIPDLHELMSPSEKAPKDDAGPDLDEHGFLNEFKTSPTDPRVNHKDSEERQRRRKVFSGSNVPNKVLLNSAGRPPADMQLKPEGERSARTDHDNVFAFDQTCSDAGRALLKILEDNGIAASLPAGHGGQAWAQQVVVEITSDPDQAQAVVDKHLVRKSVGGKEVSHKNTIGTMWVFSLH